MAGLVNARRLFISKLRLQLQRRLVSTSKKNDTVVAEVANSTTTKAESETKNWVSYGFDYYNKSEDRNMLHSHFFVTVTLCFVVGGFFYTYAPDLNLRDWAIREAFLELKRREAAGLPLVDPNLIPPEKITLPTDEELGDTEIII
ncbi:NADH dehydrogenase [ubiquinone] 1 beta subcomplex subunit 11, mitochondrial [Sitophilus oryzae]|uniref:NADH dehydrogenase [ubiquinone] 1 beta subcomplex subunit 11, mitochondrial n=1 Tax=Sitophilus oryzae TaxID=7048 RepID=A0A6J2XPP2_SITOR|nr:NADH dehydrogenase [ubiquinone] 1 beta subcomplex subunit 11, mitochondrial [Sitophilus oryzae]XP_030752619.1 NADH dehydrogenase [ubiquinone] 1 beta subcomplex subunit 11, mitochondrial [Sitophilus oryzae]